MANSEPVQGALTDGKLREYANASIQNARALINEASVLASNSLYPRAYFLAVAAIEEIGKALLAFDAQGRNLQDPALVTKLLKSMTNHESKIRFAFMGFLVADVRKNLKPALELILALQAGREPAMYTDLRSDFTVHIPAAAVRETAAKDCIRLAKQCLQSAEHHIAEVKPRNRSAAEDQLYSMKSAHAKQVMETEDFWWYYLDRLKRGDVDFSEAVVEYRNQFLLKQRLFGKPTDESART